VNELVVVGLSHKTAPVELRERCRIDDLAGALGELRGLAAEAAVLTTCNRFELYLYDVGEVRRIVDWIAQRAGADRDELQSHCYVRQGRNACKHLFFVASSLDSLVVGETQIRGQVKQAYHAAHEAGGTGPVLNRLFQAALRVSKEISESTGVGRGNVSVAAAAADLAERVFGPLDRAAVLVVGAGETAELAMTHLASRGVTRFAVHNRTPEHARALAERFGGAAGGLDGLEERLWQADVLVTAAAGDAPLIAVPAVRAALRRRRGRPVVAIDIAVPRGVDPAVDELDNIYRFDMDALTAVTQDALRHRRKEFLQCCTLVDAATLRLQADTRALRAGPAIAGLEAAYLQIAERELDELAHRLPDLPEAQRKHVRRAVHRIVRKLLHMPVRAIRGGDPAESEVIQRVFAPRVEEDPE